MTKLTEIIIQTNQITAKVMLWCLKVVDNVFLIYFSIISITYNFKANFDTKSDIFGNITAKHRRKRKKIT